MNHNDTLSAVELTISDKTVTLPLRHGTLGESVIDVATLQQHGYFTLDAGFMSTASCESKITFIDGQQGILLHRGYPIEQLARRSCYLELCYLLINGELPLDDQLVTFKKKIAEHTMVNEQIHRFFNGFRRDAHPMSVLCGVVGALSSFYHDYLDINNAEHREKYLYRAVAKLPTLVAMCYKYYIAQPFMYPLNKLSYVENFLHMMFGIPCEERTFHPEVIYALDVIFMLHADHEQNASTSTVRMAGSTGANPFVCVAAGIAALWGPSHGGANEAVINMLAEIGSVENIDHYIARAKDKNDPFLLMGFGHRVYKNFDPRASVLKEIADRVLKVLDVDDPSLEIAYRLEEIALNDEYFIERKLYPNVDFYSGIILKAMGFPTHMFTALFALARTVGWMAHWKEMIESSAKIARPRQLYTGVPKRDYPA